MEYHPNNPGHDDDYRHAHSVDPPEWQSGYYPEDEIPDLVGEVNPWEDEELLRKAVDRETLEVDVELHELLCEEAAARNTLRRVAFYESQAADDESDPERIMEARWALEEARQRVADHERGRSRQ